MAVAVSVAVLVAAAPLSAHGITRSAGSHPAVRLAHHHPRVYRVGRWHGIRGNQPSLAAAIRKLRPGDWLLIGPGDHHPRMDYSRNQRRAEYPAAMNITVPHVHVRGMNRNRVIIDGTRRGSRPCSARPRDQDFGPRDSSGRHRGRNGIDALRANGVYFENFTVCNFLSGSADSGNEIWWNGGDDGGKIGLGSWWGNYLSATSTYYSRANPDSAAQYGLFVSNSRGPGSMRHTYASNFSDSGYYVGACPNCRAVIDRATSKYNALGYSGTNSGGHLVVEHSVFAHNKTGFVTNSQNSADAPSPQSGACPGNQTGFRGSNSCWIFRRNLVKDNNDPNVPAIGDAAIGPVGTGIVIAGGRFDTVAHNRFVHNGAWAILPTIFPDTGQEASDNVSNCHGGVAAALLPATLGGQTVPCLFDAWGNRIFDNTFRGNGFYGNQTNGDIADLSIPPQEAPGAPADCVGGNRAATGTVKTWPMLMATLQASCDNPAGYPDAASTAVLGAQVSCATQAFFSCPPLTIAHYPRLTNVVMHALPRQPTMPDPCAGVPANPWCRR
jgi:hypothetical protein